MYIHSWIELLFSLFHEDLKYFCLPHGLEKGFRRKPVLCKGLSRFFLVSTLSFPHWTVSQFLLFSLTFLSNLGIHGHVICMNTLRLTLHLTVGLMLCFYCFPNNFWAKDLHFHLPLDPTNYIVGLAEWEVTVSCSISLLTKWQTQKGSVNLGSLGSLIASETSSLFFANILGPV